ncbi:MAG: TIGR03618 family F420-dependent PPOX class oxidoreductase [Streptosporangiales bacterium]
MAREVEEFRDVERVATKQRAWSAVGMDIAKATEFVRTNNRGILITRRPDGGAQPSPVLATIDAEGALVVSTREPAYKVRNLRRDPYATYCGFTDQFFGDWVRIEGPVELVSLPDAMDGLVAYYRATAGEHEDWDAYRAAMERERRLLVRVHIEQAGPDRAG